MNEDNKWVSCVDCARFEYNEDEVWCEYEELCDIWNPDSAKLIEQRPLFVEVEEV